MGSSDVAETGSSMDIDIIGEKIKSGKTTQSFTPGELTSISGLATADGHVLFIDTITLLSTIVIGLALKISLGTISSMSLSSKILREKSSRNFMSLEI